MTPKEEAIKIYNRCYEVAKAINEFSQGKFNPTNYSFPTVQDGLEGIKFIEKSLESNAANSAWIKF